MAKFTITQEILNILPEFDGINTSQSELTLPDEATALIDELITQFTKGNNNNIEVIFTNPTKAEEFDKLVDYKKFFPEAMPYKDSLAFHALLRSAYLNYILKSQEGIKEQQKEIYRKKIDAEIVPALPQQQRGITDSHLFFHLGSVSNQFQVSFFLAMPPISMVLLTNKLYEPFSKALEKYISNETVRESIAGTSAYALGFVGGIPLMAVALVLSLIFTPVMIAEGALRVLEIAVKAPFYLFGSDSKKPGPSLTPATETSPKPKDTQETQPVGGYSMHPSPINAFRSPTKTESSPPAHTQDPSDMPTHRY